MQDPDVRCRCFAAKANAQGGAPRACGSNRRLAPRCVDGRQLKAVKIWGVLENSYRNSWKRFAERRVGALTVLLRPKETKDARIMSCPHCLGRWESSKSEKATSAPFASRADPEIDTTMVGFTADLLFPHLTCFVFPTATDGSHVAWSGAASGRCMHRVLHALGTACSMRPQGMPACIGALHALGTAQNVNPYRLDEKTCSTKKDCTFDNK